MFVLLVLIAAATPPNPYLSEARVNFQAQDFTRCLKRLEQAASWKSTHPEEAEVALYRGLCRFGTGEEAQASGDFEHALRIDPAVALPAWTSPRIQTAFEQARARVGLTASPPASAVAATQPPPGVVTPTEPPRRLGKAPFLVSLGVGVAALGLAIGLGVHARALETSSFSARFESDARAAALGARDFATGANASFGLAAAAAIAAGVLLLAHLVAAS